MNKEELLKRRAAQRVAWRKEQFKLLKTPIPLPLLDEKTVLENMRELDKKGEDFERPENKEGG